MIAFVFPGQGSQHVGMGSSVIDSFAEAREVFEAAGLALGEDLAGLCRNGPEQDLTRTVNAQPAIMTASIAILRVLRSRGLAPNMAAGLSLGEYSALVAAGSLDFQAAVRLVRSRAQYMQEAVPEGQGAMAAIIGLRDEQVWEACRQASEGGLVEPANFNCPGQVIVSGQTAAVSRAASLARKMGGTSIPLKVSAPFHCSLMIPAADRLRTDLDRAEIRRAAIPVYANVTATVVRNPAEIREALYRQVFMPVLWEKTVREMISQGARVFVEIGPGKTLASLIKKIEPSVMVFTVNDSRSIDGVLQWKEAAAVGP